MSLPPIACKKNLYKWTIISEYTYNIEGIPNVTSTDLTNFEAEPAQEVMCDVIAWVKLRRCVNVLLELKPIQNLLFDSL